jgi:hypothetical protein
VRYFAASLVSYIVVFPIAVAGFVEVGRRPRLPAALLLLTLSEVLTGLIFFPERYRIPIIDPTLLVFAGVSIRWSVFGDDGTPVQAQRLAPCSSDTLTSRTRD